jgi:hypothetical protein
VDGAQQGSIPKSLSEAQFDELYGTEERCHQELVRLRSHIAKSLRIDIVFADVLPGDKASKVNELQPQRTRRQHRPPAPLTNCTETGRRNVLWRR